MSAQDPKRPKGSIYRDELPALRGLSGNAMRVYVALLSYANWDDDRDIYPGGPRLARDLGVSRAVVRRGMDELLAAGLIVEDGRVRHGTKRYRATRQMAPRRATSDGTTGGHNLFISPLQKTKTKICAAEPAPVDQSTGDPEQDRPPPSASTSGAGPDQKTGKDAGEQEERKEGKTARQESALDRLRRATAYGTKSELWQALSAFGVRLGGQERFRLAAQEEHARQAAAYMIEQVDRRGRPSSAAAFFVWAWKNVGGRGAEALSGLRKALVPPRAALDLGPMLDSTMPVDRPEPSEEQAKRRHAEQVKALQDLQSKQRLKTPWTEEEKALQARLDAELALRKTA